MCTSSPNSAPSTSTAESSGASARIGPAVYPIGGGSAYEWSKFVPIPGGRGITNVFARACLMGSGQISGDVESGSVPLSW